MYSSLGSINPLFGYVSRMGQDENAKATATQLIIDYLASHITDALNLLEEKRGGQTVVFAAVARSMTDLVVTVIDNYPSVLDQRDTDPGNTLFLHALRHANDELVTQILLRDPQRANEKNLRKQGVDALLPKAPRASVAKIIKALKEAHALLVEQAAGISAPQASDEQAAGISARQASAPQPSAPPYPNSTLIKPSLSIRERAAQLEGDPHFYNSPFYKPPLQQAPDLLLDPNQFAVVDQDGAIGVRAFPEEPASIQEMPDSPS